MAKYYIKILDEVEKILEYEINNERLIYDIRQQLIKLDDKERTRIQKRLK